MSLDERGGMVNQWERGVERSLGWATDADGDDESQSGKIERPKRTGVDASTPASARGSLAGIIVCAVAGAVAGAAVLAFSRRNMPPT